MTLEKERTLEQAIHETRILAASAACLHLDASCIVLVLEAAEKWAAIEWWGDIESDEAYKWFSWMKQNCNGLDGTEIIVAAYRASQEGKKSTMFVERGGE